ncbi:MAG: sialate O-acetylesterase [Gemmataceae bacterium]
MNLRPHHVRLTLCLLAVATAQPASAADKPLKVYLLAGQSNMQGHARVTTLDSMADDPKTATLLKEMRGPDGKPKVCERVWISSVGCLGDAYSDLREKHGKLTAGYGPGTDKFGPEFTFGLTMEKLHDGPILLIKTAWGGRNLHTEFRPPSAGPEQINAFTLDQWKKRGLDPEKETAKIRQNGGVFYKHMIDHTRMVLKDIKRVVPDYDAKQGYELAGFVWFQGFNDLVDSWTYPDQNKPGGYDQYADLLGHLIRDVRKDLAAPKLPVVIGVMGIGGDKEGAKGAQKHFREAQVKAAALDEFKGNVFAVHTSPFWADDLEALANRWERVNNKLEQEFKKGPPLTGPQKEEARKKAAGDNFTPAEWAKYKGGVSNGGYHYLGAARVMAPIGKAFAEALMPLKPVKVFLLAGQSNMEGHGFVPADPKRNGGRGSLEFLVKDAATADRYKHLVGPDGKWAVRDDVWVHYLDRKGKLTAGFGVKEDRIGPELGFGQVVGDAYAEPVLLVKLCWGGKSLGQDFRPPSSGGKVGPYYTEIVKRSKDVLGNLDKEFPELAGRGYVLAGFGWHQGWNDRVNQAFNDEYEKNMVNFIRDVRKDLGVKNLPFVIAETGMSGAEEKHPRALSLMKAQAAAAEHPEFLGNVAFVGTKAF